MKLESIVQYLHEYLNLGTHPDYPTALNGLQVEGRGEVGHISAAVDASQDSIDEAITRKADLLLVHHGMFWDGLRPLTGRRFRKVERLISAGVGLYSVHLPLDSHPEVGNCALLARRLGVELKGRFGTYQGTEIGWWGELDVERDTFQRTIQDRVGGPVRLIPGGPQRIKTVGVITGGGGSLLEQAV